MALALPAAAVTHFFDKIQTLGAEKQRENQGEAIYAEDLCRESF